MASGDIIGIVGLGRMGRPVGRHLLADGYGVVGFDPVPEAAEEAGKLGIETLDSPAAVGARSDLVLVLVGFDAEVEACVFGAGGIVEGAQSGTTIAIGSTISPRYAREVEARLTAKGLGALDVPSARGQEALENRKILILGAGEADLFERWRPMFETFASDVRHLGAFGAGQVAKMANNMILWATMAANDEALRLAEGLGLDPAVLREALKLSSAQNWALSTHAEEKPIPWAEKDILIAMDEADPIQFPLPVAATAREAMKAFKSRRGIASPQPARAAPERPGQT